MSCSDADVFCCSDNNTIKINRGALVEFYWATDITFYKGTIKHWHNDGKVTVFYEDGENNS